MRPLSLLLPLLAARSSAFPVVWHVGSGWDSVNGSVPAPGWPAALAHGWQCTHPGAFFPSLNVTAAFGVENCTRIQCGPGCTNPPCADWTMGLFPRLRDGAPLNGGVPQAANLSAHLANLRATVPRWIPDPDWDGLAVFDFEDWTNVWELMIAPSAGGGWHSVAYQNYSIELERRAHPGRSEAQLRAAAKLSFESAATDFLVQTLRLCRALRPRAKWGLYGYPQEAIYDVGNSSSPMTAFAERQLPIFRESSALFPSIYLPSGSHGKVFPWMTAEYYRRWVKGIVQQTVLLSKAVGRPPVFPFAWSKYHNGSTLLTAEDAVTEFVVPKEAGADGLVWWGGNEAGRPEDTAKFWQHTATVTGPLVKKLTELLPASPLVAPPQPAAALPVHDITGFGAVGDGQLGSTSKNTAAFAAAFAAARKESGGATVLVPKGEYYSGPITFTGHGQTLQLAAGARIIAAWEAYGSMERATFNITWPLGPKQPEGPESSWNDQYQPFIYAHNLTAVALVGPGTVDGGGEAWWNLKDKTSKNGKFPKKMAQRPFVARFDGCHGVTVRDLSMVQSPFWNLVPTWCTRVDISNVSIRSVAGASGTHPYNTDGIEPMASTDVHIRHVFIQNGDDSITIKSGCRNVLVEDCVFQDGHGCNVGSVQGDAIDNVTYRNIALNNTLLGGGRIKARHWVDEWVVVSNVLFENISCVPGVERCADNSIAEIDMAYGGGPFGKAGVTVVNATWRNINVTGGKAGAFVCLRGRPCSGIVLDNVRTAPDRGPFTCQHATGRAEQTVPSATCLGAAPPTPPPAPAPPSANCTAAEEEWCPRLRGKGAKCSSCVKAHGSTLKAAGCFISGGENAFRHGFCGKEEASTGAE